MAPLNSLAQRVLLTGGFALAVAAAPLLTAVAGHPAGPLTGQDRGQDRIVATCPSGEVLDQASGACKPTTDKTTAPGVNPINPENVPLQPGEITSSRQGDVGSLPEVDGIPCNGNHSGGGSTGACIGLQESQSTFQQPKSSIASSP